MLYPVSKGHQYGGDKNNTGTPQPAFSFVFDDSVEIKMQDVFIDIQSYFYHVTRVGL